MPMRNTVPLGSVVATDRAPPSSSVELSAGNDPVDQTTQLSCLGRRERTFLQISSMEMIARPSWSCPVTTRLIFKGIAGLPNATPAAARRRSSIARSLTFVIYTIALRSTIPKSNVARMPHA